MIRMRVELQQGDERFLLRLEELEEELKAGRIPFEGQVRRENESVFQDISAIPSLKLAAEHPDARLSAAFRRPLRPWGLLGLALLMCLLSVVDPRRLAMGWEPTLVDGHRWTVLTAPLTHLNRLHLIGNLPILLYCGWRVQRALGGASLLLVGASAVAGASLMVLGFGENTVVGASILAWGFCGAQVTIGIRFGESIPVGQRGFYGIGNLIFAMPLYLVGLGAGGVSHLAHGGGLMGGALAAWILQPETRVGTASFLKRQRRNLYEALGILSLLLTVVSLCNPASTVKMEIPGTGLNLWVPPPFTHHPHGFRGLPSWTTSDHDDQPIFGELAWVSGGRDPQHEWGERLHGTVSSMPAPPPRGPGWTSTALRVCGEQCYEVTEQRLQRGQLRIRLGYVLREDAPESRRRLYARILETAEVGDPPDLAATRRAYELSPTEPARIRAYAEELERVGEEKEARNLLTQLQARSP